MLLVDNTKIECLKDMTFVIFWWINGPLSRAV